MQTALQEHDERWRASIGTLSPAPLPTEQKKTAAKKLNEVSRKPIFGSSSLHAAPFQSSKRSTSGSAFQSTIFIQLCRNFLDSAHG